MLASIAWSSLTPSQRKNLRTHVPNLPQVMQENKSVRTIQKAFKNKTETQRQTLQNIISKHNHIKRSISSAIVSGVSKNYEHGGLEWIISRQKGNNLVNTGKFIEELLINNSNNENNENVVIYNKRSDKNIRLQLINLINKKGNSRNLINAITANVAANLNTKKLVDMLHLKEFSLARSIANNIIHNQRE